MRKDNAIFGKKKYLITLQQRRSVIAMIAGVLILSLTFMAIIQGVQSRATGRESLFHYFTVLSNIFSAVGAAFMIPYAVEGIRRKRFVLPRWVVLFQYCGALGVFITLTSAVMFILPVSGIKYGPRACAEFSSVAPDGDPGGEHLPLVGQVRGEGGRAAGGGGPKPKILARFILNSPFPSAGCCGILIPRLPVM